MLRPRLIVLALLLAPALRPMPAAAAAASPPASGAPAVLLSAAALWEPWALLGDWLGRFRTDCGPGIDPLGGCTGNTPGTKGPAAAQREDRSSARPAGGRFRLACGAPGDPYGGCTAPSPSTRKFQARQH